VNNSGEGVATIISLDGADVDNDICTFLQHSFRELQYRHPDFPQPSGGDLAKLASRAGRRFIVASTMMKFIVDDGYKDPSDRLQLMLELTSALLAGTEVYKLYDCILSTCADPKRAYLHLSIVAALADPLPLSEISKLLGPGQGCDAEKTLVQLRSVMDIPIDTSLPVNIYHTSVRDYVSDPLNCSLLEVREHNILSPHALLAESSLRLIKAIPKNMALLDALLALEKQSNAMQHEDHDRLKDSLAFLVQPPEPLSFIICMLWLRGDRTSDLQFWLRTVDGRVWLQSRDGRHWLRTRRGRDWLQRGGQDWLQTQGGRDWLQARRRGRDWLRTQGGQDWLQTQGAKEWLRTPGADIWLRTRRGRNWLQTESERERLQAQDGEYLQAQDGEECLQAQGGEECLQFQGWEGWLQIQLEREWFRTQGRQDWLQAQAGRDWLQTLAGRDWLRTQAGRNWLQTQAGGEWLWTWGGRGWLRALGGGEWLQTLAGRDWLQTLAGRYWLQTQVGGEWLGTQAGRDWLQTQAGRDWLQTQGGDEWLQTQAGRDWLQTQAGRDWLQTQAGRDWLQTQAGQDWLQTQVGRDWLQTQAGRDWLQTPHGEVWQSTHAASVWVIMEEFARTLAAINECTDVSDPPAFQVIQLFKTLPDFLMFPVFLALRHQHRSIPALPESLLPDREIIHAVSAFDRFANEAQERSQSASDALKYACHNWVVHLSHAPHPWDDILNRIFQTFWNDHITSWLEMEWCLKGLRSCSVILSVGQTLMKVCVSAIEGSQN
jgi:hypothetical protein